ncbi:sirohydrochlorin chelatase [Mangrovibacterium lignilyticum]|uniref:sirohydrochlorin chelatase n=1 Tax=Mangrovibacterium lignilyticum TaxID=2668052 RepID=UPI0013D80814|nr:CbiX/SirB N-terminal domain-containing protein [Mangrovibacterium lignilyticum]
MQKQAVIILGHGSKSTQAVEDFNYIVALLKEKMDGQNVFGAHMELAAPSLEEVVAEIAQSDVNRVVVIPYFLLNGNHIKEDIPEILTQLKVKYPQLDFHFGKPIGREPLMAEIMYRKVQEIA